MTVRRDLVHLVTEAEKNIAEKVCKNEGKYKSLLKNLIIEGLIRLLEPKVYVRYLAA